jgi:uncharacterized protein YjiS (DUF1127 family)
MSFIPAVQPIILLSRRSRRGGIPRRALAWLLACHARQSERRALAELNERLLQDVGVTRSDVAMEIRKPFWMR